MTRELLVGFDSAWADRPRNPGALACLSIERGQTTGFHAPHLATFEQARAAILERAASSDLLLVAIDQPTIVPNQGGFRPVEKVAASMVGRLKGGVQPGCRGGHGATMFGDGAPIWRFLEAIDAVQDPERARLATTGRFAIEVFPALALPSLIPAIWLRRRAAKYNPAQRRNFLLADWHIVCDGLALTAGRFGLHPLADWARAQHAIPQPRKADQDRLDAALCLLIAYHWRHAPRDESIVLGDGTNGYIVTPVTAETRRVLTLSAASRNVPVDAAQGPVAG